ncbi:MAG: aminopeptidase [Prolixibacteraceae bacterium]|nr:aminopeptidase [Prolixibacteraceae bacterium]MBN2775609.1 aminopeptidase [Prolixibacteraceae bacterium]
MRRLVYIVFIILIIVSQDILAKGKGENTISNTVTIECTPVKSQGSTGTCWSFATTSFLEAELLRIGKGEFDLSEMYFVNYAYKNKAEKYFLYHGNNNFGQGGQAHDVLDVIKVYGIVPDDVFPGIKVEGRLQHRDLINKLNEVVQKENKWNKKFDASDTEKLDPVLKEYLGKLPTKFEYEGKQFTPESFSEYLDINPDDYIELTSYNHHPFYQSFDLELPDNWSHSLYYNIPIDELVEIMVNSLEKGYTFCWDGDTSEKLFEHKKAKADLPKNEIGEVSQELRQETFFDRKTTDDHLMHITGLAKDDEGRLFFNTKNSWGATSNDNGGFLYMSEDYLRLKTIAIMVHRDVIPAEIAEKLNL